MKGRSPYNSVPAGSQTFVQASQLATNFLHCCNLLSLPQTHVKKIGIRMASLSGQVYHKVILSVLANSLCLTVSDVNIEEYFIVHVKSTGTIECLRNSARVQRCTICSSRSIPPLASFTSYCTLYTSGFTPANSIIPLLPDLKCGKLTRNVTNKYGVNIA